MKITLKYELNGLNYENTKDSIEETQKFLEDLQKALEKLPQTTVKDSPKIVLDNTSKSTLKDVIKNTSKVTWIFTHLGGYELMQEGTETDEFEYHQDACAYLCEKEIFYYCKDCYEDIIRMTDDKAFEYIANWYADRYDDGGGWGTIECSNTLGLVDALRNYEFNFK